MTKTIKKVFLVGFMASGKTTLGKKIANSLHLDFFDFDSYISSKIDKSISDIFNNEGEVFFPTLTVLFYNKQIYNTLQICEGTTFFGG